MREGGCRNANYARTAMTAMTVVPNRRSVKFSSCALIHASSANTPPGISGFMIRSKAECPDRRKIPKKKPRVGDGAFSSWPVASRNCRHHHECCGLLIRDARNGSFGAETRTLTFDVISFALATQATERELFLRVESQVTTTRPLWDRSPWASVFPRDWGLRIPKCSPGRSIFA